MHWIMPKHSAISLRRRRSLTHLQFAKKKKKSLLVGLVDRAGEGRHWERLYKKKGAGCSLSSLGVASALSYSVAKRAHLAFHDKFPPRGREKTERVETMTNVGRGRCKRRDDAVSAHLHHNNELTWKKNKTGLCLHLQASSCWDTDALVIHSLNVSRCIVTMNACTVSPKSNRNPASRSLHAGSMSVASLFAFCRRRDLWQKQTVISEPVATQMVEYCAVPHPRRSSQPKQECRQSFCSCFDAPSRVQGKAWPSGST
ncbi:hypothetical protein BCV70DRAFT_48354 [Testicularia cyperi]|uniref:Uncharacterized protein n=1 Tax=Testicularia cyperi TaxID=1882483 RepID=A0A317XH68_9BASI|nr:hypothetical protein BCV70DRAFT_48354 [Testicularia cyperi]